MSLIVQFMKGRGGRPRLAHDIEKRQWQNRRNRAILADNPTIGNRIASKEMVGPAASEVPE